MKTKDQMINVVKKWYHDISNLQSMHRLVVVVRDNAGVNKSQEIKSSLSEKEFGIISVLRVSNDRIDPQNQQSIRLHR